MMATLAAGFSIVNLQKKWSDSGICALLLDALCRK